MKYRPSRLFVGCMVSLLATGAAGAWMWNKANSAPSYLRANSGFWQLLAYKEPPPNYYNPPSPEQIEKTRRLVAKKFNELLDQFPEMRIKETPVPDEMNGYLRIHLRFPPMEAHWRGLSPEFRKALASKTPSGSEDIRRLLEEHQELVGEIEHIASLENRSSTNMPADYTGFIRASAGKTSTDILLLKARLAAEEKNETEALRCVAATLNLAAHYNQVEEPTLLGEAVAILIHLNAIDHIVAEILPALGKEADLPKWKAVMRTKDFTSTHYADILRAEWRVKCKYSLMPVLLDDNIRNNPPDVNEFIQAYTELDLAWMKRCRSMSLAELVNQADPSLGAFSHLSQKSRELGDLFYVSAGSWVWGAVRGEIIRKEYQAALDLLILEKSGRPLDAETSA
ncbi:MAG TPA: hypothetical protein VM511_04750, partial [Luteolibacter sp.]|nr:hypothetical protein [Luteolibacter sp.]